MGSGIKMSVLLFSFAFISAISIDKLPENNNVYIKPAVVIDEKTVEYKLDDLNIIQPIYFIVPKDKNESFIIPEGDNRKLLENIKLDDENENEYDIDNRKLLENIKLDDEEYDENDNESDIDNENTSSRKLLKKARALKKSRAPKQVLSPKSSRKIAPMIAVNPTKVLSNKFAAICRLIICG